MIVIFIFIFLILQTFELPDVGEVVDVDGLLQVIVAVAVRVLVRWVEVALEGAKLAVEKLGVGEESEFEGSAASTVAVSAFKRCLRLREESFHLMLELVALLEGARLLLRSAILLLVAIALGVAWELAPPDMSFDFVSTSVSRMVVLAAVGGWRG